MPIASSCSTKDGSSRKAAMASSWRATRSTRVSPSSSSPLSDRYRDLSGNPGASLHDDVPNATQIVAGLISLLLVAGEEIERLAIIGPLELAILALHHGPALHRLFPLLGEIDGPFLGAVVITARGATLVLVKDI